MPECESGTQPHLPSSALHPPQGQKPPTQGGWKRTMAGERVLGKIVQREGISFGAITCPFEDLYCQVVHLLEMLSREKAGIKRTKTKTDVHFISVNPYHPRKF